MIHILSIDFTWQKRDIYIFLPIVMTLIVFIAFWFTMQSVIIKKYVFTKYAFDKASVIHNIFTWVLGFILFFIVPVIVCKFFIPEYSLSDFGLTVKSDTTLFSIGWIMGLSFLVVPLAYKSGQKPKNLVNYPNIRAKNWTLATAIINASGLILYLFAYEFLFRGILLFPIVAEIGLWPAIAINIALYAATHIQKGIDETIGAIPMAIALCILTLMSGTIWIAFLIHVILALTNSFTALKFHPEMNFKLK